MIFSKSITRAFSFWNLVEGETLADVIAWRGALPVEEALNVAKQISEALEAAHERGIVCIQGVSFRTGGQNARATAAVSSQLEFRSLQLIRSRG